MSWPVPILDAMWERVNGWPDPVKGLRQQINLFDRRSQQNISGELDDPLFRTVTGRRRRIEVLHTHRAVGLIMLSYNDIKSMSCATPLEEGKDKLLGLSAKFLAESVRCSLRTAQRRVHEYIHEWGFAVIDVPARRDPKGRFKFVPAITALTRGFYNWIGVESGQWFNNMTEAIAEKRNRREQRAATRKAKALEVKPNPKDKSWIMQGYNAVLKKFPKLSQVVKSKVYAYLLKASAPPPLAELIALTEELATGPP